MGLRGTLSLPSDAERLDSVLAYLGYAGASVGMALPVLVAALTLVRPEWGQLLTTTAAATLLFSALTVVSVVFAGRFGRSER
ncbi:MAG: hypothetical protein ABEH56_03880 [Salinirussus sp.]